MKFVNFSIKYVILFFNIYTSILVSCVQINKILDTVFSKEKTKTEKIFYQGWLLLGSKQFQDENIYNPIPEDDYDSPKKTKKIPVTIGIKDKKINDGIFRLNTHFNPSDPSIVPTPNSFYFRLNEKYLYYSESKDDIRVIDSFYIYHLSNTGSTEFDEKCFRVDEQRRGRFWTLCAETLEEKKIWLCKIGASLGSPCKDENIQLIRKQIVKQPMIIIPIPSPYCNEKWNYKMHGDDWNCDCKEGKNQSPIDLPNLYEAVRFYNQTKFKFFNVNKEKNMQMIFENYMLKIKGNFGTLLTYEFLQYEAFEMQFHTRSDHSINNEFFDLEVEILFRCITPGNINKQAVLSVLYKIKPGAKNKFFDEDIEVLNLPDMVETNKTLHKPFNLQDLFIYDDEDFYQPFSYYQYEGSLSSPSCEEETIWYVVSTPIPISYTVVEYFKDALKPPSFSGNQDCLKINLDMGEDYMENYRNIQNRNGRIIYYYENTCLIKKPPRNTIRGHYEKVEEKHTKYFYVPDEKPSGIPGAFTVSEAEAKNIEDPRTNLAYRNKLLMLSKKINDENV